MATITARKIDDRDYAILSEIAAENGRSISEELRLLIAERAAKQRAMKLVAELQEFRESHQHLMAPGMDAVTLVRAVRDGE